MDQMLAELRAEGYDVEFITVNKINAAEEGYQLAMIYQLSDENEIQYDETGEPIYRCTYPLVQDVEEVNAWELHAGKKDDFYIYGTDGMLARFLPSGTEEFSTRLSTEEGYNNLKGAIIEVLEGIVVPESQKNLPMKRQQKPKKKVQATSRSVHRCLGQKSRYLHPPSTLAGRSSLVRFSPSLHLFQIGQQSAPSHS